MARPLSHDPFDALGDPNRRAILEHLSGEDLSVREISDRLPISRPAVSRHLRLLKNAGLVTDRSEGARRVYRLDRAGAAEVRRVMEDLWGSAGTRFTIAAENTTPEADSDD
ncbi:MAG: metalloregulator ArsR/SmtB family transcription factor [Actinomycetia bacterium]|nr:metalloregulator ArsR/SmtB family transcription factor [Actinomycetes bacterium]